MYLPLRTRGGGRGRREGIRIRFAGRVARALCAAADSSARVLESITSSTLPVTSECAHRRGVRYDLRREFRCGFQSMRTSLPRRGSLVLLAALTCDATRRARRTHRVPYAPWHLQLIFFLLSLTAGGTARTVCGAQDRTDVSHRAHLYVNLTFACPGDLFRDVRVRTATATVAVTLASKDCLPAPGKCTARSASPRIPRSSHSRPSKIPWSS